MDNKKSLVVLAAFAGLMFGGCGHSDGTREFADGERAMKEGRWEDAVKLFSTAVDCLGDSSPALLDLAICHLELGNIEEAGKAAESAQAISDEVEARLLLAQVAFHKGDYKSAYSLWNGIARDDAQSVAVRSEAWNALGVLALTGSNTADMRDEARICFFRALRLNFKNAQAWYHLGKIYREQFLFDDAALEMFKFYARLADANDTHLKRVKEGVIPELTTSVTAAASELASAPRAPGKCAVLITEGDKLVLSKQYKRALAKYMEARAADPTSGTAAARSARMLERVETSAEGIDRAVKAYKAAAKLSPQVAYFVSAAKLALKINHVAEAASIVDRGLARSYNDRTLVKLAVDIYRKQNKRALAAAYEEYLKTL